MCMAIRGWLTTVRAAKPVLDCRLPLFFFQGICAQYCRLLETCRASKIPNGDLPRHDAMRAQVCRAVCIQTFRAGYPGRNASWSMLTCHDAISHTQTRWLPPQRCPFFLLCFAPSLALRVFPGPCKTSRWKKGVCVFLCSPLLSRAAQSVACQQHRRGTTDARPS